MTATVFASQGVDMLWSRCHAARRTLGKTAFAYRRDLNGTC